MLVAMEAEVKRCLWNMKDAEGSNDRLGRMHVVWNEAGNVGHMDRNAVDW